MNGFLLMIPFLLIRFGMLAFLGKNGMQRAAHYAPVFGKEKAAYWIILAEERECISRFGDDYKKYMEKVRRYI